MLEPQHGSQPQTDRETVMARVRQILRGAMNVN